MSEANTQQYIYVILEFFINLTNFWIPILVLLFITFALAGSGTISQYIVFPVIQAKAIKHKHSSSGHPSNKGSTAPSSQSNNVIRGCISYSQSTRTITVSCGSARFTDIDNKLKDTSVLKQSPSGIWFLSANILVAKGATFSIDSTDTRWLKISSIQEITTTTARLCKLWP
jgi:hypothetical protein